MIAHALNKGDYEGAARRLEHLDDEGPRGVWMHRQAEAAKFRFNTPDGQFQDFR